ncbi:zinc knuckle (CCHC-type) family protein [Zea mays]|uniref:Zinc knuckle (CCHC-type) family protein n=1 Tax=Zea mays TaxID=4577 RepID=A0A1D6F6Y4_MAIZE|nr:zinc knuckle (CCHC-type) family protein [Zea mays]
MIKFSFVYFNLLCYSSVLVLLSVYTVPIMFFCDGCCWCLAFSRTNKPISQGQDCFICKKGGHMAKDCPDKHKRNDHQSTLCIRCGETGHDMFGCANDYPPDDIEQIRCYACNQKGHLCCSDFFDNSLEQVSCYNCAQSGHSGLGCAKQRREASAVTTPTLCFKCGEEGHFARGCTKNAKSDGPKGWSSPHSQRKGRWKNDGKSPSHIRRKEKWKKDSSARSAPHDACTTSKSNSPSFEERMGASNHKSKWRGGWTGDDDLPSKKYKPNGWGSPATPKRSYTNHQYLSGGGDYFTPQSSRRHNHGTASPGARKHRFSSSIFAASNTHVRFKRS